MSIQQKPLKEAEGGNRRHFNLGYEWQWLQVINGALAGEDATHVAFIQSFPQAAS